MLVKIGGLPLKDEQLEQLKNEWIVEATISEIQEKLENKEITSKELVLIYLSRISEIDQSGASINSMIEVNP